MKIVNLKQLPRALSVIAGLGLIAGCGNIERPGDNANQSQPTVVLSTPAAQPTTGTGAAAGAQPVPALPADIQVQTLPSGLQYADVVVGSGQEAKTGDTVSMLYTGYLTDGTVFDSNVTSGQPYSFPLGQRQVIQGWDEGIVGMKVGGKRRLIIPAALGYGAQGAGGVIPPDAELIFDVELVSVAESAAAPALPAAEPIPALPADIALTTTESGLQYADLEAGAGPAVKAGDMVGMYYTGYLADGTIFDRLASGDPLTFTVGNGEVIPGWDEGIVGMKENSKRRLIIPSALAYGSQGAPGVIPPDADLTFDVELKLILK